MAYDDLIDQTVGLCLLGSHIVVALGVDSYLLHGLTAVGSQDLVQLLTGLQDLLSQGKVMNNVAQLITSALGRA